MELENYESHEPCLACNESREGMVCFHHVTTRGSGGLDEAYNLMPLCFIHHTEIHKVGLNKLILKFPQVRWWLTGNGWEYVEFLGKWLHNEPVQQEKRSL